MAIDCSLNVSLNLTLTGQDIGTFKELIHNLDGRYLNGEYESTNMGFLKRKLPPEHQDLVAHIADWFSEKA